MSTKKASRFIPLEPDMKVAKQFLIALKPKAKSWTFQTFAEKGSKLPKDRELAKILHGTFDQHAHTLADYNKRGAAVFAAVNRTDGLGRKTENIIAVRAVVLDLDDAPLEPVFSCRLKPHIIVETSPSRHHVYWRVKGLSLDEFEDIQRSVAERFDGDSGIAKLTHCARLPGFFHAKNKPFRSRIIAINDHSAYDSSQIVEEFPPLAKQHKPSMSNKGLILYANSPLHSAKEFAKTFEQNGKSCLVYYCGVFYEWVGTHYKLLYPEGVRSKLYAFLEKALTANGDKKKPFNPSVNKVNQILDALKAHIVQTPDNKAPFWLPPAKQRDAAHLIACQNGTLDFEEGALSPHSPSLFNVNCLTFDYDPEAAAYPKLWMEFLRQLWPDDGNGDGKRARYALQEMFGLLLTPDTSLQKIFMIVGPPRSGKGTIARVLTALLGKDNVAAPTLASLSFNFGLQPLIDKRAAIISDAKLGPRADAPEIAERLLSISGEDGIQIDKKYKEPWTGRLDVRFLILSNELPRIADASGALTSRFVLLTLANSFLGKEDTGLTEKLLTKLPGILNWSLRGLKRLHQRGYFEMPEASIGAIEHLEDLASPVKAFLRARCDTGPNKKVNVKYLFNAYVKWCEEEGTKAGSNIMFGRNLRAAVSQMRTKGKGATRAYLGIDLKMEGEGG